MKKSILIILVTIIIPYSAFSFTRIAPPFKVGEYLEFEVRVFNTTVAVQKAWVKEIVDVDGIKCYHILADIETKDWIKKITSYKLHDIANEYIDVNTLLPVKIFSKIHEGSWTNNINIKIDRNKKILYYIDKRSNKQISYKGEVVGLISLLYYSRTLVPQKDEKITFVLSNADRIEYIDSNVESINAPLFVKDLNTNFISFLYKQIGGRDVSLWISQDENRLPIRMISMKLTLAGYGITNIEAWLTKFIAGNGINLY